MDCDPGHDDAFALILAAKHLNLLGVTTVAGNQTIEKVTSNALKILEVIQRTDIPVHRGSSNPWIQPLETAPMFHGESGLDGPRLPLPTIQAQSKFAAEFIRDSANEHKKISLIATGPLTNLATALQLDDHLSEKIEEIYIMGGSVTFGNWTPMAEFNIYVDPEAASKVFNSGIPIYLCGLNLTRQAFATEDNLLKPLKKIGNPVALFCYDLLAFFIKSGYRRFGIRGASLHDACAAGWAIDPSLIQSVDMHVHVELQGKFTRGMTVCDYRHTSGFDPVVDVDHNPYKKPLGEKPNCSVGVQLDVNKFFSLLLDAISSFTN